ncbi:MAG: DNA N-6-adenine-methyltransferase [Aquihabitans sp.]
MTLIGFKGKNHPQQTAKHGATRDVDDRATTAEVFEPLDLRFGGFTVDVAAAAHNAKCDRFFDVAADGLGQPWAGERVWCNPPYSAIGPWVRKAWAEHGSAGCIVMLLPANRTEQGWWRDLVEPFRGRAGSPLRTEFIAGRLRFMAPGQTSVGANERPPFGCVLLIWQRVGPVVGTLELGAKL